MDRQADRCTESRIFKQSAHTYNTYRQTDRMTDRTDKHRKTNRPTDIYTGSICVMCKKILVKI